MHLRGQHVCVYTTYCISDLFGEPHKDYQINCMPLSSHLYCKHGFSPHSTEIHQFKILPVMLFEQIAKY